ncbi:DinB family protein [Chloroflexota bacterium]
MNIQSEENGGAMVDWKDLLIESYGSAFRVLEQALQELTQEDLNWQPRFDCNSIGWTTWHLTRVLDGLMSSIMGEEELWIKDRWHSKFNRSPDTADHGYGPSPEQVALLECPDIDTLLNYLQAVLERSKSYLATLSRSDLSRKVDDSRSQLFPTVGSRLTVILDELLQHAGQVGYIRGLIHGKGWQEF